MLKRMLKPMPKILAPGRRYYPVRVRIATTTVMLAVIFRKGMVLLSLLSAATSVVLLDARPNKATFRFIREPELSPLKVPHLLATVYQ